MGKKGKKICEFHFSIYIYILDKQLTNNRCIYTCENTIHSYGHRRHPIISPENEHLSNRRGLESIDLSIT